jgi:hypothetical protein
VKYLVGRLEGRKQGCMYLYYYKLEKIEPTSNQDVFVFVFVVLMLSELRGEKRMTVIS